jgi:hypothetical protein
MTKARVLPGRQVDLAKPPAHQKKGNSFAALAGSDSDTDSEPDTLQTSTQVPQPTKPQQQSAAPQPQESVEDTRSRWSQFKPSSDFPSLFQRAKGSRDGALPVKKIDLSIPQFQQDEATTGGPYSPKTPPWWPDMVQTQQQNTTAVDALRDIPAIPDIATAYPYAPMTPPLTSDTPPLTQAEPPPIAPTMTMAMRIKETLDTVTADRAAKAQTSPEERAERIKKSLEGLSFFRRADLTQPS